MNYPADLKYTASHEWLRENGEWTEIGITDYAQDALGDIVFVNLPEVGDAIAVGEAFADVESVKAVSDVFSPVTGVVAEVNEELAEEPGRINSDPYETWIIKVLSSEITEYEELLDSVAYEAVCQQKA